MPAAAALPNAIHRFEQLLACAPRPPALRTRRAPTGLIFEVEATAWTDQQAWARESLREGPEWAGLVSVPPIYASEGSVVVARDQTWITVALAPVSSARGDDDCRIPASKEESQDPNSWLDFMEWSAASPEQRDRRRSSWDDGWPRNREYVRGWNATHAPFAPSDDTWREVDRFVAGSWIALQRGVPEALLVGPALYVPIGAGIVAEVLLMEDDLGPAAVVDVLCEGAKVHSMPMTHEIDLGLSAGTTGLSAKVPRRLTLGGDGLRAEVRFVRCGLLHAAGLGGALVLAVARALDEQRRRWADYDDDD